MKEKALEKVVCKTAAIYLGLNVLTTSQYLKLLWPSPRIDKSVTRQMISFCYITVTSHLLQWRHNERNGVSNHRRIDCSLKRLYRRRSKKTSKYHAYGFCERNPSVTGG